MLAVRGPDLAAASGERGFVHLPAAADHLVHLGRLELQALLA
jgi:hypothetical protein